MIALFRNYTPFAVFLLLFLTVFTRLPYLNTTLIIDSSATINYPIWHSILQWWHSISGNNVFLNGSIVILLILLQALALNKIANRFDLFNNPSYLTAMTYTLIVGLVPSWNTLSLFAVVNLLLILLLERCIKIYLEGNNPYLLVNIGILTACIVLLLNIPGIIFLVAAIIALLIFRPFKWKDVARLFFGFLTPYYLLFGLLFLNNNLPLFMDLFEYKFTWQLQTKPSLQFLIGIIAAVLMTIGGCYYLSKMLGRMVIHTKRYWWIIFIFFFGSIIILPFTFNSNNGNTFLLTPFLSLISTNLWLEYRRKWISNVIITILILTIIILQWY